MALLPLICSVVFGSVSVCAETTDMSTTNAKLDNIANLMETLTGYVDSNKNLVQDITEYIHGENGNYSLNSLIYNQTNDIQTKITNTTEILTTLQEQTVSQNSLLEDVKQRTGDTTKLLLEIDQSNDGIASTLTTLSTTLDECSADLAVLSQQAQADINNQQLLNGLNQSIDELNQNIDRVNKFLGFLYAGLIFAVVVTISIIIFRILWNTLIKNMFSGM